MLKEIVMLGLKFQSVYWLRFAVNWLSEDFPIDIDIIDDIIN